jgi:Pyridoxamine 5'-phosphate oxidase
VKETELLKTVRHIALATVNEDGKPHNTPLFFIYNDDLSKLYWGSHPDSLHSKNIQRTASGFALVFDSREWRQGGLYLKLKNAHVVPENELPEALRIHNEARARWGNEPLELSYYQQEDGQCMYVAEIAKIEGYGSERDADGKIIREGRIEISAEELMNG